jgi:serine/threonine-protein kinase
MAQPHADRNLLFGILALQLDFIGRDQLLAGLHRWVAEKHRPLGEILTEQGALTADSRDVLERLIDKHLECHQGLTQRSLASVSVGADLHEDLLDLGDAELNYCLTPLAPSRPPVAASAAAPLTVAGGAAVAAAAAGTPTSSGLRFLVLRPHAEGGLGMVSVARDQELNRDVALKEIKPTHAHDAASQARFLAEAEITGGLEHPGVVPVYGLGRFDDGRPFYAMRFIQGESLDDAIRHFHRRDWRKQPSERHLVLRNLLQRFIDVCNAVAYAHGRGVLHRDLKPANVMLGRYGETLLVDWGLAKSLLPAEGQAAPPEGYLRPGSADGLGTRAGAVVGTPAYMAPEQAEGKEVGPAADVYSLGATLYQLLTGQPPFASGTAGEVLARVRRGEYRPPREVKPSVPAALAAVCVKAMACDPGQRYASARDLAGEVERWLADEPVAAYREPWRQRLGRWGRRHRAAVVGLIVLLLAGVVGLGLGLWAVRLEQQRTAAERDLAEGNLKLAKQAVDECFLVAKENTLLKEEEMEQVRKLLLEKALPFYRHFTERKPHDPAVQEEMAEIQARVGYIYGQLGKSSELLAAFEQVRGMYAELAAKSPGVLRYRIELGDAYGRMAFWREVIGDHEGAWEYVQEALRIVSPLAEEHPEEDRVLECLANAQTTLALVQVQKGEGPAALRAGQEALRIQTTLAEKHPGEPTRQEALADAHNSLGMNYHKVNDTKKAFQFVQRAIGIQRTLMEKHPEVSSYRWRLAGSLGNFGLILNDMGDLDAARRSFKEAVSLLRPLTQQHPTAFSYQSALGINYNNLCQAQHALGDFTGAFDSATESVRLWVDQARQRSEILFVQTALAEAQTSLGMTELSRMHRKEARQAYEKARRIWDALAEKYPEKLSYKTEQAGTRVNLALVLAAGEEYPKCLDLLDHAITTLRDVRRRDSKDRTASEYLRNAHLSRAETLVRMGRPKEAAGDWKQCAALEEALPGGGSRAKLAYFLAGAEDLPRAAQAAEAVDPKSPVSPLDCYNLACIWALAGAAQVRPVDQCAVHALVWLRKAQAAGFFKDPAVVAEMRKDSDLHSLRERDDFKKFLAELEKEVGKEKPKSSGPEK